MALAARGEDPSATRVAEIHAKLGAPDPTYRSREEAIRSAVALAIAYDQDHGEALNTQRRMLASVFLQWSDSINPNASLGAGLHAHGLELMARLRPVVDAAVREDTLAVAARALMDWHEQINPAFSLGAGFAAQGKGLQDALREEIILALSVEVAEIRNDIAECAESYAENMSQYRSECALFGDAGPGQGLALREARAGIARRERQVSDLLSTPEGRILAERHAQARARYEVECARGDWDLPL